MAGLTPSQIAANWKKNLGAAGDKIKQKVAAVTESPMEKAAAQQDLMRQRMLDSIDSGAWAAALRATPITAWKNAMSTKGVQNMQAGLTDGESKVVAFQQMAAPVFDQIKRDAAAIAKDGTTVTALRKVEVAINGMKALKGRMKGH